MVRFEIIRSRRRTLSIEIARDGSVLVRAPYRTPDRTIADFVSQKKNWILKKQSELAQIPPRDTVTPAQREILRKSAKEKIPPKVEYWSRTTGLCYRSIRITAAEQRFGSCSAKNGLCFSLYLVLYPEELIDYVIVHELCHTVHHDHSLKFHQLLARYLPDWKERERALRKHPLPHVRSDS